MNGKGLRRYRVLWATVGMILLGGALIAANYLSSIYYERRDLTAGGAYSLSLDTERILTDLDRKATLHFFPLPDHVTHGPYDRRNRRLVTDLLREYTARTDQLSLRLLPPARFPDRVRTLAARHGVNEQKLMQREPVLITVPGSGNDRIIPFDRLRVIRSGSGDQTASRSDVSVSFARAERAITSSIVALTRSSRVKIAFRTSSGDGDASYRTLRSVLSEQDGFAVHSNVTLEGKIASEIDVLVLGPGRDAARESERAALRDYLERGGSVVMLVEPDTHGGLASLCRAYGIDLTDLQVTSPTSPVPGVPPDVSRLKGYRSHPITAPLKRVDVPVFMRGIRVVTATEPAVSERNTDVLLGASGSAERLSSASGTGEKKDLPADVRGSDVPVAVASESVPKRSGKQTAGGRLVVFGDADWVQDGLLSSLKRLGADANLSLFRNAVRWSAGLDRELRFIPDRGGRAPFVVTEKEGAAVFTLVVVLLPGCALLLGLMIWWFRRMRV